jgi:integrase/recombinase XerD
LISSPSTSTITSTEATTSILDRKIEEITAGLSGIYSKNLLYASQNNAVTIIDYIAAMRVEINPSDSYRKDLIEFICRFSKFNNNKPFKELTRTDVIAFLDTLRKTETQDPLHKWIGTYNVYKIHLLRFFKWLYSPDIEPHRRQKPSVIENIPQLHRKETSTYKPSDLWTQNDDLLFLRYCPTKREKCYHAISRDLSARPHEILKLKIRDISFKTVGSAQYAEVVVNGKTGTRAIPLINSIPYLKDYLDHEHPMPRNPNSPLICGTGRGLGRHIKPTRVYRIYEDFKNIVFPKLLESPNVLPEDKQRISELLKKPWNPYIRRHSALTEKARILKEPILKMHAGWSSRSQEHLKYEHWFGNDSNESLLEAYGLVDHGIQMDQLKPKACTNCNEPNKPDSRFCAKCRMVLTYDAYAETLKEQEKQKNEMEKISKVLDRIDELEKRLIGTP